MSEVVDNPQEWVADHIRRFLATGGRPRPGVDDLLLTTRGRRTGTPRRTALTYGRDSGSFVVVASNAGADVHPAWYLDLVADPAVIVEVGAQRLAGTADRPTPRRSRGCGARSSRSCRSSSASRT